jgi:ubiquinone/menaquinone biosynthesis C-methylase UbiE
VDESSMTKEVLQLYKMQQELYELLEGDSIHPGCWAMTDRYTPELRLRKGMHVLEAGSNIGTTALRFVEENGVLVTGVDVNMGLVLRARARARARGLENFVTFHNASLTDVPEPDAKFDALFSEAVVGHVADRDKAIGQFARLLKPSARIVLTDMIAPDGMTDYIQEEFCAKFAAPPLVTTQLYADLFEKHGFEDFAVMDLTIENARALENELTYYDDKDLRTYAEAAFGEQFFYGVKYALETMAKLLRTRTTNWIAVLGTRSE